MSEQDELLEKLRRALEDGETCRVRLAEMERGQAMLREVRATIVVNAMHTLGCTREQAEAYARGTAEETFIAAMIRHVQERDPASGTVSVEAAARWKEALEEIADPDRCPSEGDPVVLRERARRALAQ